MPVALHSLDLGGEGKEPLVILHGLLGSSRNWLTAGKALAEHFHVNALDLRNHGDSPLTDEMDFELMAEDLAAWLNERNWGQVNLLGHSMGGKTAIRYAVNHPDQVRRLIVVDISPRAYHPRWQKEFELLLRMPVGEMKTRREAEQFLEEDIRDWAFRQFLLSNLERKGRTGFRWRVNLEILHANLPKLFGAVPGEGEIWQGPALFVRGERSKFILPDELPFLREKFPMARLETVQDAGHNVHFDQKEAFVQTIVSFQHDSGN